MKSLLFYGTTDYGYELNRSDKDKFLELSENFHSFVTAMVLIVNN